jgi:hypothetical protein
LKISISGNRGCLDLGLKRQNPKYPENFSRNQLQKPFQRLGLISYQILMIEYGHDGYKKSSFDADSQKPW